jgi:hypothetical protein
MTSEGIRLFRGLTPGALGLDVHGSYGETWAHDFAGAEWYARPPHGYVLEAVLSPDAKRLVLVTVDEEGFSDYREEGIQELAQIVGDPMLYDHFISWGGLLWDSWEPEWTETIKAAGYDSIFTGVFDGPEEYVLNASALQFVHYYRAQDDGQAKAYPVEPGTLESLGYVLELITAVE